MRYRCGDLKWRFLATCYAHWMYLWKTTRKKILGNCTAGIGNIHGVVPLCTMVYATNFYIPMIIMSFNADFLVYTIGVQWKWIWNEYCTASFNISIMVTPIPGAPLIPKSSTPCPRGRITGTMGSHGDYPLIARFMLAPWTLRSGVVAPGYLRIWSFINDIVNKLDFCLNGVSTF